MIRFTALESRGVRVAAMSEIVDGDCRLHHELGIEARLKFFDSCGVDPLHVTTGKQTHSANVAVVAEEDRGRGGYGELSAFPETDGLVTNVLALPLVISIADCVPVFILDPAHNAIGLVHAGRVGTENSIAYVALKKMRDVYGTRAHDVYAVIGPSAGPDVYEVSDEMAGEFAGRGFPVRGRCIDLWEANAQQLESFGVPRAQIEITGLCTMTSGRFHSHRAHNNGKRNIAVLML